MVLLAVEGVPLQRISVVVHELVDAGDFVVRLLDARNQDVVDEVAAVVHIDLGLPDLHIQILLHQHVLVGGAEELLLQSLQFGRQFLFQVCNRLHKVVCANHTGMQNLRGLWQQNAPQPDRG